MPPASNSDARKRLAESRKADAEVQVEVVDLRRPLMGRLDSAFNEFIRPADRAIQRGDCTAGEVLVNLQRLGPTDFVDMWEDFIAGDAA